MKNSILLIVMFILFAVFLIGWRTVEFTATWDLNIERDMSHYNLYCCCQGGYLKINNDPIMHPTTSYKFTLKLSDESTEALCFVVTAVDKSRNESRHSEVACVEKRR